MLSSARRPLACYKAIALSALATLAALASVSSAHAQFSAVTDFSTTLNPNGNWRYGQESTLGGTFSLLAGSYANGPSITGFSGSPSGFPVVAKNTSAGTVSSGTITMPNDLLLMHPASDGTYSVVRFIAPTAGLYTIAGRFQALDSTTTDVHVLINNLSGFDSSITQAGTNPDPATANRTAFNLSRTFAFGDTVDFAVGRGSNGTYLFDSTGLSATITQSSASAPDASSLALVVFGGVAGLGAFRRRLRAR